MPAVAARAAERPHRIPEPRPLTRPARRQPVRQRQLELRAAVDRRHLAVADAERERCRGRAFEPHDRDGYRVVGAHHLATERATRRPVVTGQDELQFLAGAPASSKPHHKPPRDVPARSFGVRSYSTPAAARSGAQPPATYSSSGRFCTYWYPNRPFTQRLPRVIP